MRVLALVDLSFSCSDSWFLTFVVATSPTMHHSQLIQMQHTHPCAQEATEYHPPRAPATRETPAKTAQNLNSHEHHSWQLHTSKSLELIIIIRISILPILDCIMYGHLGLHVIFLAEKLHGRSHHQINA
jgi:hypothetical protein